MVKLSDERKRHRRWRTFRDSINYQEFPACWFWPIWRPVDNDYRCGIREWQDEFCAICHSWNDRLYQDHCHVTGLVRGYLCPSCNTREGLSAAREHRNNVYWRYRWAPPSILLGIFNPYYGWGSTGQPDPAWDWIGPTSLLDAVARLDSWECVPDRVTKRNDEHQKRLFATFRAFQEVRPGVG